MSQRRHRFSACNHLGYGVDCHRCAQANAHDALAKKLAEEGRAPTISSTGVKSGHAAFIEKDLTLAAQIEGRHYRVVVPSGAKGATPEARSQAVATLILKLKAGAADLRKVPDRKAIVAVPQSA